MKSIFTYSNNEGSKIYCLNKCKSFDDRTKNNKSYEYFYAGNEIKDVFSYLQHKNHLSNKPSLSFFWILK